MWKLLNFTEKWSWFINMLSLNAALGDNISVSKHLTFSSSLVNINGILWFQAIWLSFNVSIFLLCPATLIRTKDHAYFLRWLACLLLECLASVVSRISEPNSLFGKNHTKNKTQRNTLTANPTTEQNLPIARKQEKTSKNSQAKT